MSNDPQGLKWQITINNPITHGFTHEHIKTQLEKLKSIIYYCLADEIGEEQTPHTHIFAIFSSNMRFSTLKNLFESAYLTRANGSAQENRDYITKTGKWADSEKAETSVLDSFEEWGEMPVETRISGGRGLEGAIISRILDGVSNAEILLEFPDYLRGMRDVEFVRQTLKHEEYREKWRDLETVYVFGSTGVGKTRSVMDGFGYSNVYAVNNYKHPFDGYTGESVMLFDEFNSSIRIQDMNNYLDGYPLALPARYSNKQACFERVFIISNLDLREQYRHEQINQPEVWQAFLRRIHKVIRFTSDGKRYEYDTQDYLYGSEVCIELPSDTPMPFDDTSSKAITK